jgi:hypothetical protein
MKTEVYNQETPVTTREPSEADRKGDWNRFVLMTLRRTPLYPVICQWTLGLLPCLGYCE